MHSIWILYFVLILAIFVGIKIYYDSNHNRSVSMYSLGDSICDETGELFHIIGLPDTYNLGPHFKRAYVYRRMDGRTFVMEQEQMEDGRFRILNIKHKRG